MLSRSRFSGLLMGLSLVAALGILPSFAQDPAKVEPTTTTVKKVRRVPSYFGQIGLTSDQKEKIYEVRAKHALKLDDLKKQIASEQVVEMNECEAILLESQKKVLVQLRTEAKSKIKARGKATADANAKVEPEKKAEVKADN